MELTDLPRDINASLANIRRPLITVINSCRRSATKRALLIATLERSLEELNSQGGITPKLSIAPVEGPEKKPAAKKRATAKVNKDAL